jgi:4-hydroxy-3-methylbut-2-enyl diphosphate reductase
MDPDLDVDDPHEQTPGAQAILLLAPRRSDARALRRGLSGQAVVLHTGVGPRRSRKAAQLITGQAVAVAGIGRALAERVHPGDVVVADQVRTDVLTEGMVPPTRLVPSAARLTALLREKGLTVHVGTVISTDNRVNDTVRDRLAMTRALIADRESAWLLATYGKRPIACVRVAAHRTSLEWRRTSRTLRIISATLTEWAS